ncbi:MAG: flagellar hook-length control protein FliK [Phycisphaerae bacterium]|nr:flagellar hook-length control protein FliK [Phycisphaerae bacterium]
MNISLSKNLFAANVGSRLAPSKSASASNKQSTEMPADDAPITNTGKTVTTDNIQLGAQNMSVAKPSESFSRTLGKKITTKISPNEQTDEETKKQAQDSVEMLSSESLIPQGTLTQPVELDKTIGAKVDNQLQQQIESEISDKSAQLLTDSKTSQAPSLIVQDVKPIIIKPDQIVSEITKLENKSIPLTIDQSQTKSEIIIPDIPDKSLIDQKNSQEIASGIYAGDSKITINYRTDSGESISQSLSGNNKAITGSEKSGTIGKPIVSLDTETTLLSIKPAITSTPPSNQQNQQSGKEANPETLISGNKTITNSEPSVVTNESGTADRSQIQLPNIQFAAPAAPDNQTQTAEKTTSNKADTDQKGHRGKTEFFELLGKNGFNIENLSVKSIAQKMSQSQMQSSAPQAENRSDLVSQQASGPDIEAGNQLLVGNNVQPAITEQSPASAASTKSAGNADSGAGVSSQIQESIYSSFRSGSQQIVIRLNPPDLGKVAIKFTEQGNGITGLLQVDKPQTRNQIQQALPEIIQNLQNSGIQINKLEVVLTNQQEQYTPKDQSSAAGQNGWSGQQNSQNPESQINNTVYSERLTNVDNFTEFAEIRMQFTDNSINMLV